MTAADAIVDELTTSIDYLRITVGGETGPDWLACAELISDPAALGAAVVGVAPERGAERAAIATSLFVQGYAFRIAAVTIGTWLLGEQPIAVDPTATAIALGRGRPNALRLDGTRVLEDRTAHGVHEHLVDGHLAPLVENARASCRIGRALLWGNVASSIASCFNAVAGVRPSRRVEIRRRAADFFAAARPELRDAGEVVPVGIQFAWERRSCCLWYQTATATGMCGDCSLHSDAHRAERYAAMLAEQATDRQDVTA